MELEVKVTTEITEAPSRRANATFVPCPVSGDLYLFGGEFFSGAGQLHSCCIRAQSFSLSVRLSIECHFYNDMFRYQADKNEWRQYLSPNSPGESI